MYLFLLLSLPPPNITNLVLFYRMVTAYSTAVIIAIFTQGSFMFLIQYLAEGYQALYKYEFIL
jgi:hypothetical protein